MRLESESGSKEIYVACSLGGDRRVEVAPVARFVLEIGPRSSENCRFSLVRGRVEGSGNGDLHSVAVSGMKLVQR